MNDDNFFRLGTTNDQETERSHQSQEYAEDDQIQISSNGHPCTFPFKYGEETFWNCTVRDSDTGIPWCATEIDDDGILEWGDCKESFDHGNRHIDFISNESEENSKADHSTDQSTKYEPKDELTYEKRYLIILSYLMFP